ncbi:solute carrier organic anion transporter family member 4C1 [Hydra vulgaris]|uniref:solute carrier organic anion transporter family member 4C1 n=1 Tax=Hydra vulgaris TaxID=6087 RepID=UPI0006415B4F|nr:solute carrier organic anion transporter family member 4C1 isoform X1 [Hydra vulgaris]XP_012564751.1 solute carrier organic anion transporter family member 4C1 isoform X1 [Hydra vulgaris]XP_012564752.1 solute carrier organic anion transporter family member 4C1 isoform X1 [Hydra vulgaris]XP_047127471.1 solute carrier organic anion transporter family member 4C1 isoform X1 [Hydra vulgaris]
MFHELNDKDINAKYLCYGWFSYRPAFLQSLNRPQFFLICVCWLTFAQGLVCNGLNNVLLTSIEKRYGFTTIQIALFSTMFNATVGFFSSLVCYVGHKHRPRALAVGGMTLSVGMFVLLIPHFISPKYEVRKPQSTDLCHLNVPTNTSFNITACKPPSNHLYLAIFLIGHSISGLGNIPVQSLSYAHLESITDRSSSSMYFLAMKTMSILGPASGYILGSPILRTYVDIQQPPNSNLKPNDLNWVGAWWIGYMIGALLLLTTVIPFSGFPKMFINSNKVFELKKSYLDTIEGDLILKYDIKSVWPSIKCLLLNTPYMYLTLGIACESFVNSGFSTFFSKFVETQFHFSASKASLYSGLIVVPACGGGIGLGGFLSKRFGWDCQKTLKVICVFAIMSTIFIPIVLIGCDEQEVVGVAVPYLDSSNASISLNSTCNINCHCNNHVYKPVCSINDQKTFYSPCHAGCIKALQKNGTYHNCACSSFLDETLVDGPCISKCTLYPYFVVGSFFLLFVSFMNAVPLVNATFWTLPLSLGSLGIGFQQVFLRFLGMIPSSAVFGRIIDASCLTWNSNECTGENTNCLEYSNKYFRLYIFLVTFSVKTLSCVLFFLAYKTYKLPKNNKTFCEINGIENFAVENS